MRLSLVYFLILLLTSACGGGGGSSSQSFPSYAGAWKGLVRLVSNSCPRVIPDEFIEIALLHNVDQGMSKDVLGNIFLDIVLSDGIDTYVGIGEFDENGQGNAFSVTGSANLLGGFIEGFICREIIDFQYDVIDFSGGQGFLATAGFVTRHSSITCTRDTEILTCDVTYTGSADKTAANLNTDS